jgi:hypothetical protein
VWNTPNSGPTNPDQGRWPGGVLATLPFAIICVSSSTPKLERRHEPHAPFTHMYIMKQPPDFTQGPLPVYTADGNVAFKFAKNYQDPLKGVSSITLMDSSSDSHPLITLKSVSFYFSNHDSFLLMCNF